ncbi:uncharacterized protein LOC127805661 [Diospyros lotus]|uniref:uncharacterized protein LOC127805661 n=1 Tax=Diospyros lotus TaxID=55363 RepID=UPI00225A0F40|nr:uncharacterized protein LOC127805661 [Diospyros lotus]
MNYIQEIHDVQVRVFKWNEILDNVDELHNGLFMFKIANEVIVEFDTEDGELANHLFQLTVNYEGFTRFRLRDLSSSQSTQSVVSVALENTSCFNEQTMPRLREDISNHLLGCFKFDLQEGPVTKKPIVVVVVDVHLLSHQNGEAAEVGSEAAAGAAAPRGKLSVAEAQEIRETLMVLMEEPIRLPVKPMTRKEPTGFHEVDPAVEMKEFEGVEEEEAACAVCLEKISKGMRVATTPCSHTFHSNCLFRWLPRGSSCPLCRCSCATII